MRSETASETALSQTVLASKLEEWRLQLSLGHNAFARRLGINRATWSLIRRGKRGPSKRVLGIVLRERPDLGYFAQQDLAREPASSLKKGAA